MRLLTRIERWRFYANIAMLVILGLVCTTGARASAILQLTTSTGTTVVIPDNGLADLNPSLNAITFSGSLGLWTVNVSTVLSKDLTAPALLGLNSVNVAGAGAGSLTIMGSDNGFLTAQNLMFSVAGFVAPGWSAAFTAYGGSSNTLFDLTNEIGSTMEFSSSVFTGQTHGGIPGVNPYSLTIAAMLDSANIAGTSSFDAVILPAPVPEPGTVSFVGGGLLVAAWLASTRRRRSTPE